MCLEAALVPFVPDKTEVEAVVKSSLLDKGLVFIYPREFHKA